MYRLAKEFTFAMGHRLSCHSGLCRNFHGHNYRVLVGIKSKELDKNGMVMDFSDLKAVVEGFLYAFDHALMVNESADEELINKMTEALGGLKTLVVPFEPTAENMAREIYQNVGKAIEKMYDGVKMDYVTVYETDNSAATYDQDQ